MLGKYSQNCDGVGEAVGSPVRSSVGLGVVVGLGEKVGVGVLEGVGVKMLVEVGVKVGV